MVTEIAIIDVKPGTEGLFVKAFGEAGYRLLAATPGFVSGRMLQSRETPTRFVGVNEWESTEAHVENFRRTDRYDKYRALLRPYIAATPVVEHFDEITIG